MPVTVLPLLDRRVQHCLYDVGVYGTLPKAHELHENVRLLYGAVALRENLPSNYPERPNIDERVEVFRLVADADAESLARLVSSLVGNAPLKDVDSIRNELGSLEEMLHTLRGPRITQAQASEFARMSEDIQRRVDRATSAGIARCLARTFEQEQQLPPEIRAAAAGGG
ncbi:MAG: hypothetical protein KGJ23_08395 [Euryarchaeota archaeon]|nr:hypothetical protein [Euryarchaeota archaeon]MDE1836622.1 hypothetical protein [Euryarchaeota archaeon]MDE1879183.1 hypothetical protein [Euryarchaeota archaeon]MDE2044592.1 hypothetical protein [Thermoplasmata archaeon]